MNVLLGPAFFFGTGLDEWAVLGAICFLLFGPKRLPEIARTLGRTLEKLRRAADDFREQLAHLDEPPPPPPSPPPQAFPAADRDPATPNSNFPMAPVPPPTQSDGLPPRAG